jgi:hypothetical protein
MAFTGKTNFSNGGDRDRAILNKFYLFPGTVGNVFYVNSAATGTGDGFSPVNACTTVAAALALCAADNFDTVVLLPNHNEGIGDAQLTWNVDGVKIVGVGEGSARPRFDFDHANASIDITADDVTVENITLLPSVTAVLVGIDVNAGATNVTLRRIESLPGEDGAGVDEFAKTIDVKAGATRLTVEDCLFTQHASAAGVVSNIALTGASDLVTIRDCTFWAAGAGLVAPINGDTTLSTRLLVERCLFTTDAEPGIELLTGTTGVLRDCDVFTDLATIDAAIVADACAMFECRYVEVGGEASAATYIGVPSVDD